MKKQSNIEVVAKINAKINAAVLEEAGSLNSRAGIYSNIIFSTEEGRSAVFAWFGTCTEVWLKEELKKRAYSDAVAKCGLLNDGGDAVPVVWCEVATDEGEGWKASTFAATLQTAGGVGVRVGSYEREREKVRNTYVERMTLQPALNTDGSAKLDKKGAPVMLRKMAKVVVPVTYKIKEQAFTRKRYTLKDIVDAFNGLCADTSAQILKDALAARMAADGATVATKKDTRKGKK